MPSLIDLRRRIRAVKSTQQITKAMKMIAASRLKRAQERVVAARPFAQRMLAGAERAGGARRARTRIRCCACRDPATGQPLLIVITADRGLCGSFNSNIIKAAGQFIAQRRARPRGRARPDRPQGPRLLPPPRLRRPLRGDRHLPAAVVRRRRRDRQRGDRGVHVGTRLERVPRLQRVQVGDDAAHRRRAAAADSARCEPQPRRPGRPSTISTSRRRRRSSRICCRGTCRCRSTARCSSRTPRSSRRR